MVAKSAQGWQLKVKAAILVAVLSQVHTRCHIFIPFKALMLNAQSIPLLLQTSLQIVLQWMGLARVESAGFLSSMKGSPSPHAPGTCQSTISPGVWQKWMQAALEVGACVIHNALWMKVRKNQKLIGHRLFILSFSPQDGGALSWSINCFSADHLRDSCIFWQEIQMLRSECTSCYQYVLAVTRSH